MLALALLGVDTTAAETVRAETEAEAEAEAEAVRAEGEGDGALRLRSEREVETELLLLSTLELLETAADEESVFVAERLRDRAEEESVRGPTELSPGVATVATELLVLEVGVVGL